MYSEIHNPAPPTLTSLHKEKRRDPRPPWLSPACNMLTLGRTFAGHCSSLMASWATMSAPMTSLAQMARVVLDTVKFLDRGEGNY
jgi:hypothetical protein